MAEDTGILEPSGEIQPGTEVVETPEGEETAQLATPAVDPKAIWDAGLERLVQSKVDRQIAHLAEKADLSTKQLDAVLDYIAEMQDAHQTDRAILNKLADLNLDADTRREVMDVAKRQAAEERRIKTLEAQVQQQRAPASQRGGDTFQEAVNALWFGTNDDGVRSELEQYATQKGLNWAALEPAIKWEPIQPGANVYTAMRKNEQIARAAIDKAAADVRRAATPAVTPAGKPAGGGAKDYSTTKLADITADEWEANKADIIRARVLANQRR